MMPTIALTSDCISLTHIYVLSRTLMYEEYEFGILRILISPLIDRRRANLSVQCGGTHSSRS